MCIVHVCDMCVYTELQKYLKLVGHLYCRFSMTPIENVQEIYPNKLGAVY